jgi:uncharacterized membrane protein YfcA
LGWGLLCLALSVMLGFFVNAQHILKGYTINGRKYPANLWWHGNVIKEMTLSADLKSVLVGLSAGFLSGLLGLGGGIVFVPALIFFLGRTQHQAHGTSLALIVPTALVGASIYTFRGNFDLSLALWIAIFAMGAAYFGAGFANKLSAGRLRLIYAVFLLLIGIKLIWA